MGTISEDYKPVTQHTLRFNNRLTDICKLTGLSLNSILESLLVYFCTLDDEQKLRLLDEYDPEKVNSSNLKEPGFNYAEKAISEAKQTLGSQANRTSTKLLIIVGIALLIALLFTKKEGGENQ